MTTQALEDRVVDLENAVSDLRDELELLKQEHRNELDELRAEVEALQSHREEQIARAIAEQQIEALSVLLASAKRSYVAAGGGLL